MSNDRATIVIPFPVPQARSPQVTTQSRKRTGRTASKNRAASMERVLLDLIAATNANTAAVHAIAQTVATALERQASHHREEEALRPPTRRREQLIIEDWEDDI